MKVRSFFTLLAGGLLYLSLPAQTITVTGKVFSEEGTKLAGATVTIRSEKQPATVCNENGEFILHAISPDAFLIISSVGYEPAEIAVNGKKTITVILTRKLAGLDEVIVRAYGTTTRRLNTGNIGRLSADEISRQPVSDPLAALQGRIPGLIIRQTSGVPGASFKVEIRGRSSLDLSLSGNDPLFIIDGVPFEQGNIPVNQLSNAANNPVSQSDGGLSPLSAINPSDIESIEVLKDADATAIYGSRGANGVVLITTNKGVAGKTSVKLNTYTGWSRVSRTMDMLNTEQYVQMRKEAFANDGITPTVSNAPDLLVWDTTRYTDLQKLLIGGTARNSSIQASVSGGSLLTQFLVGGGYSKENNVFSNDLSLTRGSLHFNIRNTSADKKFSMLLSGNYSSVTNEMIRTDLTSYINLPPDILLWDSSGAINWSEKGMNFPTSINNPLSELLNRYHATSENLSGNMNIEYHLTGQLLLRANLGYNNFQTSEHFASPKTAIAPASAVLASASFASSSSKSWIAEPQLEYNSRLFNGRLNFLAGATWQDRSSASEYIAGSNYTNDLLLSSIRAAGNINATNNKEQYRYTAFFGRIGYNLENKYLLNLSGRRDGSSRFGPNKRFADFGAVGAGWIFSNEGFFQKDLSWISFGKFRASYGVTGNDQVGNYKYLDLWSNTSTTYQSLPGLTPSNLFNPDYNWERNRKLEGGLELGFLKDRIFFSVSYYRNHCGNQLVTYRLPNQSGFNGIVKNLPALVQNLGFEIILNSKNIQRAELTWTTSFNITVPRNRLIRFPGLSSSSYATLYREGLSLNSYFVYKYLGVDPQTGLYAVVDTDNNGSYNIADRDFRGNTDPRFYGGIGNHIRVKKIELDFFFDYRKQTGKNYQSIISNTTPGLLFNQPALVLSRWQHPGDKTSLQKFTTSPVGANKLANSDGVYTDASFARLKNVSLSYTLPVSWMNRMKISSCRIYMEAQNLLIITSYQGADPETQNFYVLPPLRTVVAGIQLTF